MTPIQWEEVKVRFHEALQQPADTWQAFLLQACSDDSVRQEAERLLKEHARADGFLSSAVVGQFAVQKSREAEMAVGARLNRYQILSLLHAGGIGVTHQSVARGGTHQNTPARKQLTQSLIDGRYQLILQLGFGGMGKVFKALDIQTSQFVAIKFIRSAQAGAEHDRMRFVREARAVSRVHHPNIIRVHAFGQSKGTLYIVMEYVQGTSLTALVSDHTVPLSTRLFIMSQVADALAHAHAHGIVHRDIKPDNIIVHNDQSVKVVDFGIAEQLDLPHSLVQGGGTALFMSPEQTLRQKGDGRSDIWATGITLFFSLTGKLPYLSSQDILSAQTPQLSEQFLHSGELNVILARALAKDPESRYSTADELAAALRSVIQMCEVNGRRGRTSTVETPLAENSYTLPDLKFCAPGEGRFVTKEAEPAPWSERTLKMQEWMHEWIIPRVVFWAVSSMCVASLLGFSDSHSLSDLYSDPFKNLRFVLPLVILVAIPLVALLWWVCFLLCWTFETYSAVQRCHKFFGPMEGTAVWTRLCHSREEVVFGYRDCMAALRHGLWQDAVNLLVIHGAKYSSEDASRFITPAKYHLKFFECASCGDHAARFTTEEMIEGQWEQHPRSVEVYWGAAILIPTLKERLIMGLRTYFGILPEFLRRIRIDRSVITGLASALCLLLILLLIHIGMVRRR